MYRSGLVTNMVVSQHVTISVQIWISEVVQQGSDQRSGVVATARWLFIRNVVLRV